MNNAIDVTIVMMAIGVSITTRGARDTMMIVPIGRPDCHLHSLHGMRMRSVQHTKRRGGQRVNDQHQPRH